MDNTFLRKIKCFQFFALSKTETLPNRADGSLKIIVDAKAPCDYWQIVWEFKD